MKQCIVLFAAAVFTGPCVTAQTFYDLKQRFGILDTSMVKSFEANSSGYTKLMKSVKPFWRALHGMEQELKLQSQIRGDVSIALNTDNSGPRDEQRITLGVNVLRGT
ncbi:MAG: hypothetical protein R3301_13315, partial [Saprospiraceae bacterium]|nr:hypothetical protein [Saprospiraceae bacterium]